MRFKIFTTLLLLLFIGTTAIQAQDQPAKTSKKVIVIEKTIDENGKKSTERIKLQGEEAEQYLRENGESIDIDVDEKSIEMNIRVEDEGDGAKVWITKNGKEEMIEIDGENEVEIIEHDGSTINVIRVYGGDEEVEIRTEEKQGAKKTIRIEKNEGYHDGVHDDADLMKRFDLENIDMDDVKTININRDNNTETLKIEFKDGKKLKKVITADEDKSMGFFSHEDKEYTFMRGTGMHNSFVKQPCDNNKAFLGIGMQDFFPEGAEKAKGVEILYITHASGAEAAGLSDGDIITAIDGKAILNNSSVSDLIKSHKPGDQIRIELQRGQQYLTLAATLGKRKCPDGLAEIRRRKGIGRHGKSPVHRNYNYKVDPCKPIIGFFHNSRHDQTGIAVGNIIDNTPAARKQLQNGDIVVSFDGIDIQNWDQLIQLRDAHEAGDRFKMTILRDGKEKKIRANFNDCPTEQKEPEIYEFDLAEDILVEGSTIDFNVFPNPSQGQVSVAYKGTAGPLNIRITDITGKILIDRTIDDFTGDYSQSFDFQDAAEGVLIIRLQQNEDVFVKKVVIQKS